MPAPIAASPASEHKRSVVTLEPALALSLRSTRMPHPSCSSRSNSGGLLVDLPKHYFLAKTSFATVTAVTALGQPA